MKLNTALKSSKKYLKKISFLILTGSSLSMFSQFSDKLKDGLKFYTDTQDSSHFIRLNMTNQFWTRYTVADPLTVVNGYPQPNIADMSIRRVRMILSGQLNDRVAFFAQFGQNNLNYLSDRKAGAFFHDVTADYAVVKKHLSLGFGLNGWNGPSRFSNISTTSILTLDPPNFQEVTNDTYDQFVRRLGIYMKGKLGKLDYRISAGKPFVIQKATGITDPMNNSSSTFSAKPPQMVYQGYFMWQFLDQESNFGPSTQGTYLGKKKVFNIGAGFYNQQGAMNSVNPNNSKDTVMQDMMLLSVDVFYDTPINKEKGTAFSFYGSYSNYNYGTNFIKVTGPDNPATGVQTGYTAPTGTVTGNYNPLTGKSLTSFNKASFGNAFPYLGTGNVLYAQAGYKFKDKLLGDQGTLQVFANCQYAVYDRLSAPMYVFDAGINWLIKGHNSKFTFDYQDRPYFLENSAGNLIQHSRYGQFVMQYQCAF